MRALPRWHSKTVHIKTKGDANMKYKREIPRQKGFWIGIGACALVGLIAATIAYFSSSHMFENNFKSSFNHSIELYDLVDADKAMNMWPGETIGTHVIIKNTGDPVLARVKYFVLGVDYDEEVSSSEEFPIDEAKKMTGWDLEHAPGGFMDPVFDSNKFLFTESDNTYYYQGIIPSNTEVQHLKQISFGETSDSEDFSYLNPSYTGSTPWEDDSNWSYSNGAGYGTMREFSNSPRRSILGVYIETIPATNPDGSSLDADTVAKADVDILKGYWDALIPETGS